MTPAALAIGGTMIGWLILLVAMVRRGASRGARVKRRNPLGVIGLALQAGGFALAFNWRRPPLTDSPLGWAVAAVSIVMALGSAAFIFAAIRTLGKQWSLLPQLVDEHALVDTGPYAIVRNPIYTGILGMLMATGLAIGPSSILLVAVVSYWAGTIVRVRLEEALLREAFGERFTAYAERVPALLPFSVRQTRRGG